MSSSGKADSDRGAVTHGNEVTMPRLNPGHFLRSLVPESREQRVYLLVALMWLIPDRRIEKALMNSRG